MGLTTLAHSPPHLFIARFRYGSMLGKVQAVYQCMIILNTLITSMLIVKLKLFLRYADWLTRHFERIVENTGSECWNWSGGVGVPESHVMNMENTGC